MPPQPPIKLPPTIFYPDDPNCKPQYIQVAIDLEWYDQSKDYKITEVGIAIQPIISDSKSKPSSTANSHDSSTIHTPKARNIYYHFKIVEHSNLINRYCKTSPLGFIFGQTELLTLRDATDMLKYTLTGMGNDCPVELIWHNGRFDEEALQNVGINVREVLRCSGGWLSDVGALYNDFVQKKLATGLDYICESLGIECNIKALHNAGNDAVYVLMAHNRLLEVKETKDLGKDRIVVQPLMPLDGATDEEVVTEVEFERELLKKTNKKHVWRGTYVSGARKGQSAVIKIIKASATPVPPPSSTTPGPASASFTHPYILTLPRTLNTARKIIDAFHKILLSAWRDNAGVPQIYLGTPEVGTYDKDGVNPPEPCLVEPYFPDFTSFNRTSNGWTAKSPSIANQIAQALLHFSYHHTNGKLLLCNLEGRIAVESASSEGNGNYLSMSSPIILLSQPTILSVNSTSSESRDMEELFKNHKCTQFCSQEWRKLPGIKENSKKTNRMEQKANNYVPMKRSKVTN
jgi:hypothetical protein